MKSRWVLSSLVVGLVFPQFAEAQFSDNAGRGAALGGVAGALAGAAIGKNNHNTAAGALIGGAAGLIGGAAIGSGIDAKQRHEALRQQQVYVTSHAVSAADVVTMTRNGVSDDVIINHIRQNGMDRKLDVNDVIALHNQGVSNAVLTAMQQYPTPALAPTPVYSRPVVVEEYHYVAPPPPRYHYYYAPHPVHYGPRPGWGFSIYGR
jgi:uncharacterized protein YcfJ